ncbi:hypothetical protein CJF32_00006385 [Rutstroemia sp. NJR-2017a WRK4]|nr:hypothetical protein CJF32_00006385 [Rutstroemia sp. NJR-2017a WRK4]
MSNQNNNSEYYSSTDPYYSQDQSQCAGYQQPAQTQYAAQPAATGSSTYDQQQYTSQPQYASQYSGYPSQQSAYTQDQNSTYYSQEQPQQSAYQSESTYQSQPQYAQQPQNQYTPLTPSTLQTVPGSTRENMNTYVTSNHDHERFPQNLQTRRGVQEGRAKAREWQDRWEGSGRRRE